MAAFQFIYKYVGPVFWGLLPISIFTWILILDILFSLWENEEISDWVEVLLAHFKETATLLGLLGSVYALTNSFNVDGTSVEVIRQKMFFVLSTGFWSTIAGVLVSLQASFGLLMLKKT